MVNRHRKEFFGSKTGIFFDSGPSSSPDIFLTFIKKKNDGSWEKPSEKEGLTIKFSLIEVPFMLQVLRGEKKDWKTSISFERDSENEEQIKVKASDYQKLLIYGEVEVFKALLEHVFQEKVINSTEVKKREDRSIAGGKKQASPITTEETSEEKIEPVIKETAVLAGACEGETEKALLIAFEGNKAIWVPKSTIHSDFDSESKKAQKFEIDTWILKKNKVITI
jgi:hypothetical protein